MQQVCGESDGAGAKKRGKARTSYAYIANGDDDDGADNATGSIKDGADVLCHAEAMVVGLEQDSIFRKKIVGFL